MTALITTATGVSGAALDMDLVSGLAVVKGACVAAVGRGWVRAGRSHSSLKARRHHRSKGITVFFVVTSPNL